MNVYEIKDLNSYAIYFVVAENTDQAIEAFKKTLTKTDEKVSTRTRCIMKDIKPGSIYKFSSADNGFDKLFATLTSF